jgi:tetratricopeptide (TPR) repeat protein
MERKFAIAACWVPGIGFSGRCLSGGAMIRFALCAVAFSFALVLPAGADDFKKPTRTPVESSAEQARVIAEGARLHDRGDYDGAIEKYESVLALNPDDVVAIYELGYSHFARKDYAQALEYARKGVRYVSDLRPQFLLQIASCQDNMGDGERAVKTYRKMIKEFPGVPLVHFNLAVTYARQDKRELAKEQLKKELAISPDHRSSHYLLGMLLEEEGYRIPAVLALSRFLILEPNTERSGAALGGLQKLIQAGVSIENEKKVTLMIKPDTRKDEGDFARLELMLSLVAAGLALEENRVEQFCSFFRNLIEVVGREQRKLGFTGAYYIPYFREIKERGYTDAFAYLIHAGSPDGEVGQWLIANEDRVEEFLEWSRDYPWPSDGSKSRKK